MTLKEKLFFFLKNQKPSTNQYLERIINKSIVCFKKIGWTELKKTFLKSILNYDFELPNRTKDLESSLLKKIAFTNQYVSLYFINGFLNKKLSNLCQKSKRFDSLNNGRLSNPKIKKYFGQTLFYQDNFGLNNSFIALNISLTTDGIFIYLPQNTKFKHPIEIINIYSPKTSCIINLKKIIVVGKNSKIKIIERHISTTKKYILSNVFTEIFLKDQSNIELFQLENDLRKTYLIDNTFIKQNSNSVCKVFTFSSNIRNILNTIKFFKVGTDTQSFVNGLSLVKTSNNLRISQLYKNILLHFFFSNSVSYQHYKGIFSQNSYGILKTKIQIKDNLDKIKSKQQTRNLLLANSAKVLSRPEFKTGSSKVKCSHGTNIGKLDKNTLFFFRTRGIGKKKSIKLALLIFANEIIQLVTLKRLTNYILANFKTNIS